MSLHEEVKRFMYVSEALLNESLKIEELSSLEVDLIKHYLFEIGKKFHPSESLEVGWIQCEHDSPSWQNPDQSRLSCSSGGLGSVDAQGDRAQELKKWNS